MAITQSALAHAMARDFLQAAPPEARLSRLWVWSEHGYIDPERDYVDLTAVVDPVDEDAHQRLLASVSCLDDLYPEVLKTLHLLGPDLLVGQDLEQWVDPRGEEIDLSAE